MLEAVVICLDNSDWSRNRDCPPSRLQAQQEAAISIANCKLQANAENSIGLVTLAGEHVQVRASPSGDMGVFHEAIQSLEGPDGKADLIKGIQTAQLALKHRLNRNQRQRIVVFVCSPLDESKGAELERVGKALKKNNVSIDVVSFGEVAHNSETLRKLYTAVNANNMSNLLELEFPIPSLSRAIVNSSIGGGGAAAGGSDDPFGLDIDPNADPELLMALRLSLEEERARQQAEAASAHMRSGDVVESCVPAGERGNLGMAQGDSCSEVVQEDRPPTAEEILKLDIDEDLRQALLLSLQSMEEEHSAGTAAPAPPSESERSSQTQREPIEESEAAFETPADNASFVTISPQVSEDQSLTTEDMKQLAERLPGIDVNDEEIIRAFREIRKLEEKDKSTSQQKEEGDKDNDHTAS